MKRSLWVLITLVFFSGTVFSQSITVSSPAAGVTWYKGSAYNITWTGTGCTDPNIKINIFRNSIAVENFVEQLTCSGTSSITWTIPGSYSSGNYQIRVKTADNICVGDSPVFAIADDTRSTGSIEVINPVASTVIYTVSTSLLISWASYGDNDDNVSIQIYPAGTPSGIRPITPLAPNIGEYNWNSPGTLVGAGRYVIRVTTADGAVSDDSEAFEILAPASPRVAIDVTGPGSLSVWGLGSPRMINWRVTGEMDDRVRIGLFNSAGTSEAALVSADTANDGSEHWVVPATLTPERYLIRITTLDGRVTGESPVFSIAGTEDPGHSIPPVTPAILIKSPKATTVWNTGQRVDILWSTSSTLHAKVKISFLKEGEIRPSFIDLNTENDGAYTWKIPPGLTSGRYMIRVTTLDNLHTASSEPFRIAAKGSMIRIR